MPGTTRYSATFDRPYEEEDEEDLPAVPPLTRRSRSASWQATTANGRPYTPLGGSRGSHARSASTDNGPQSSLSSSPAQSTERIPTRTTGKVPVKTSHNPFQFVKVGSCSLYKKAEEQLKKTQKIKQPEALKEEEEEWQTNLDSWKSRRRKMSQDVFRRQEEMKELLEMEEQPVGQQKKVKTFSEMLEERASRGRTLSLCLYSNPLGLDNWGLENGKNDSEMSCNDTHQSSGSAESSNANSEDENDVFQSTQMAERNGVKNVNNTQRTRRTGAVHFLGNHNGVNNGISLSTDSGNNCDFKVSDLALSGEMLSDKCEPCQSGAFNDSGLDSLSSSHRAGDIPDSGSDFSQDSGSSLDCDSPGITGIPTSGTELLQEFSSKDSHPSNGMLSNKEKIDGMELCLKLTLTDSKSQQYGFTINGGKDKGSPVTVASVINGSVSDLVGLKTGDYILAINKEDISTFSHSAVISSLKLSAESRQLELLLWRPASADVKQEKSTLNGSPPTTKATTSENSSKKPVPQQTYNKDPNNKAANGKATKDLSVSESSVDNKADIVDSQSNNKKSPAKQKDLNSKASAPPKSQKQEITASTVETTKTNAEAVTVAENQNGKSVESENEMFVDDFGSPAASNNSKIPVAEKSPKVMGKKISKASQETKKNKSVVSDFSKNNESSNKTKDNVVEDSKDNSLNIIYQSQPSVPKGGSNAKEPVTAQLEHSASSSIDKKVVNESSKSLAQTPTNKQESKFNDKLTFEATEILPVDKVAEQMERLILEQLEEEELLKEKPETLLGSVDRTTADIFLQEHELNSIDTPPRQAEPPKEKPPPPPTSSSCTNKDSPLKRVNSTKRIKKEIQKRRSDFLGIEKSEEEESTIPPPPDLENILKLECEQERKVREILGKESLHQRESSFEEEEIARKEREIIESLETEERMKMTKQTVADENVSSSSSDTSFAQVEVERIRKLQEERVRMEEERFLKEEQRIRLEEERQLREREEQIRREEENASDAPAITSSTAVLTSNSESTAPISSISPSVSSDASLSQTGGGKNMENVCMKSASDDQSNIAKELTNNLVATKPLKKKEVIRKERERLRQEQEALQREREEYRRQMVKEQELLKDSQKSHAPDAPVSRVGAPPPLKPALPLPLTSLPHASQALKENVSYTSRSLPTNSVNNAAVGNHNTVGTSQSSSLLSPSHNTVARSKVTQNEAWGPHKVPVVKKQPDIPSESRYNQNHWLIQEAEMRRISEQKERQQRAHPSGDPRCGPTPFNQGQYHPMHVAEENFCGGVPCALQKPPAIPGVPSLVNKPSSYPMSTQMHSPEQQWNYGQPTHPTPQGRKFPITNVLSPGTDKIQPPSAFSRNARVDPSLQAPTKPSRVIPMDRQEQMLSVSGRKRCSHCGEELGRGAAMIIESLQLYYHIQCFRCCVCQAQLGNGSCGTDVRVRNNKLHCHNCYSNDEAGLKFSQV